MARIEAGDETLEICISEISIVVLHIHFPPKLQAKAFLTSLYLCYWVTNQLPFIVTNAQSDCSQEALKNHHPRKHWRNTGRDCVFSRQKWNFREEQRLAVRTFLWKRNIHALLQTEQYDFNCTTNPMMGTSSGLYLYIHVSGIRFPAKASCCIDFHFWPVVVSCCFFLLCRLPPVGVFSTGKHSSFSPNLIAVK